MNHEPMTLREFTLTRTYDAPRDLVWKAWTEPEQLARWWGPEGMTTPLHTIETDVRPGGAFRLTMVLDADGTEFTTEMAFREVVEPERLVYEWEAQRGLGAGELIVTFTDLGDRTELTTHFSGYATDAMLEMANLGWAQQLDKLATQLTANQQGGD